MFLSKWRGVLCESMEQPQLAVAQYQVAVTLVGVAKGWQFAGWRPWCTGFGNGHRHLQADRQALRGPGGGRASALAARTGSHRGRFPTIPTPTTSAAIGHRRSLSHLTAADAGADASPHCGRQAPVITAGRFGLIVSGDHSAIISGAAITTLRRGDRR